MLASLTCIQARASTFTISNVSSDLATTGAQGTLRQAFVDMATTLESSINNDALSAVNQKNMLKAFANADAGTTHGMGADYGSNPKSVVIGTNLGVALSGGSLSSIGSSNSSGLPPIGVGAQASLLYGMSAKSLHLGNVLGLSSDRVMFYVNGFGLSFKNIGGHFDFGFFNIGAHVQYKLVLPSPSRFGFQWGGVDITTGLEYAHLSAAYSTDVKFNQKNTLSGGNDVALNYTGPFRYELGVNTFSIPIEASTNVQLLSILSLYTGLGLDFNFGSSSASGGMTAPITATSSAPPAGFSGNLYSATGKLDLSGGPSEGPSLADVRGFLGVQINLLRIKILAEVSRSTNETTSGRLGLRYAF